MVTVLHEGPPVITDRQLPGGELNAAGYSNDEVARRLGISPRTAKAHSDVLRQKLGCARRRQIPGAYRTPTGRAPPPPGPRARPTPARRGPPRPGGVTAPAPAATAAGAVLWQHLAAANSASRVRAQAERDRDGRTRETSHGGTPPARRSARA